MRRLRRQRSLSDCAGAAWGKRRLNLGNFKTVDAAKQKCQQHYADGCDVSEAERM
jgi:hypothetical protein